MSEWAEPVRRLMGGRLGMAASVPKVGEQVYRFETPVGILGAVSGSAKKGEKSRMT